MIELNSTIKLHIACSSLIYAARTTPPITWAKRCGVLEFFFKMNFNYSNGAITLKVG